MTDRLVESGLSDEPVTVVGAGVAGLACAIVLARAGRPVIVREWRKTVGSRFHFNTVGERGWRLALRSLSRSDTAAKLLRLYRPSLLTRFIYPIARWRYRVALADPSCDHVACDCVWYRHGVNHAETGLVSPIVPVEE